VKDIEHGQRRYARKLKAAEQFAPRPFVAGLLASPAGKRLAPLQGKCRNGR
jgi:hypothetical protein